MVQLTAGAGARDLLQLGRGCARRAAGGAGSPGAAGAPARRGPPRRQPRSASTRSGTACSSCHTSSPVARRAHPAPVGDAPLDVVRRRSPGPCCARGARAATSGSAGMRRAGRPARAPPPADFERVHAATAGARSPRAISLQVRRYRSRAIATVFAYYGYDTTYWTYVRDERSARHDSHAAKPWTTDSHRILASRSAVSSPCSPSTGLTACGGDDGSDAARRPRPRRPTSARPTPCWTGSPTIRRMRASPCCRSRARRACECHADRPAPLASTRKVLDRRRAHRLRRRPVDEDSPLRRSSASTCPAPTAGRTSEAELDAPLTLEASSRAPRSRCLTTRPPTRCSNARRRRRRGSPTPSVGA